MNCELIRESLSAHLDAETGPVAAAAVDQHLSTCPDCRAWALDAEQLHRRTRLAAAPAVPDLTPRVLNAIAAERTTARSRRALPVRVALAILATVQLFVAGPVLFFGHDHAAPIHIAHEVGSFDAALAVGLLLAALRPRLAAGMLPLVAAITGLLLLTAGSDIAVGHTNVTEEAPHLLDLLGLLLLIKLSGLRTGTRRWAPRGATPVRGV